MFKSAQNKATAGVCRQHITCPRHAIYLRVYVCYALGQAVMLRSTIIVEAVFIMSALRCRIVTWSALIAVQTCTPLCDHIVSTLSALTALQMFALLCNLSSGRRGAGLLLLEQSPAGCKPNPCNIHSLLHVLYPCAVSCTMLNYLC